MLPREFRMAGVGFGRMVLPFVLLLVFFGAVMLLLFSVFTGLLGGVIAAVAGPLVLLGVLYGKFSRMRNGTVVRFSEYGVELSDEKGFHVRLARPDITRLGEVHTQMANPGAIGEQGGVQVSVGAMTSRGLIGWGERTVPPNAPSRLRENLDNQPRNPVDGRPEVAIPLGGVDPDWAQGPMGQWVRQYRPDLLGGQHTGFQAPSGYAAAGQPATAGGQPGSGYPPGAGYPVAGQSAPAGGQAGPAAGHPPTTGGQFGSQPGPGSGYPVAGQPAPAPGPGYPAGSPVPGYPATALGYPSSRPFCSPHGRHR